MARKVAPTPSTVLIAGESGTGKELLARAVHQFAQAAKPTAGRFVPVNCAAVPHDRLEHQLFGHFRGAFAGADQDAPGVFVSASDYLKVLPDSIDKWLPKPMQSLGTDGFGRSDSRAALRNFFEVDARFMVLATLHALMQEKQVSPDDVAKAIKDLGIDTEKPNPAIS